MNFYIVFIEWLVYKVLKKHGVEIDGLDDED